VECSTPPTLALGDSDEDGWFRLRWTTTAVVADERIHLEELRRMILSEEGHVVTYLYFEEELVL